jgi:hypothetical protein
MSFHVRVLLTSSAFALLTLQQAAAQPVEIFGGYAVARMKPETESNRATLNGWNTSITAYPTYRVGITADFAGYYATANPVFIVNGNSPSTAIVGPVSVRQYSFMAGPQFRLLRKERFETSFKALFGGARGHVPASTYNAPDETTFAALFGSNFDVNVRRGVALRFSPGLYLTQFGSGQTQKTFRFAMGLVFRLGGGEE